MRDQQLGTGTADLGEQRHPLVAFIGPSLPGAVQHEFAATVLPPAARGAVIEAAEAGARCIVLIDGLMVHSYGPSPTEIAEAMQMGTLVIGAASIGALRAVELRQQGMVGMGWVYGAYLRGVTDADDEVLALCNPDSWEPITVPAIRVRFALERLAEQGRIERDQADTCMEFVSASYFEDRTASVIMDAAVSAGVPPQAAADLLHPAFDVKRHDALAALRWAESATLSTGRQGETPGPTRARCMAEGEGRGPGRTPLSGHPWA